jgi:hypothetical protein
MFDDLIDIGNIPVCCRATTQQKNHHRAIVSLFPQHSNKSQFVKQGKGMEKV